MTVPIRRVRFGLDEEFDVDWHRRLPEFAMAANSVSMMMPHVEPFVVRSVRGVLDRLEPDLARDAQAYAGQESTHHAQHRRFNDHVIERYRAMRRVDAALARTYRFIERRSSERFRLAFAAGAETIAYAIARWVAANRRSVLDGARGPAADLFVWHLAEEVEHKTVAFDVFAARGGNRRMLLAGMLAALAPLALFTIIGTLTMMVSSRRILHPVAWFRLSWWCLTLVFELLPTMAGALLRGHHPTDLADPEFYRVWLADFDLRTSTTAPSSPAPSSSSTPAADRTESSAGGAESARGGEVGSPFLL